jgi:hypothetical protein
MVDPVPLEEEEIGRRCAHEQHLIEGVVDRERSLLKLAQGTRCALDGHQLCGSIVCGKCRQGEEKEARENGTAYVHGDAFDREYEDTS